MSAPESRWLLRSAGWLVPAPARAGWLRQQEAELWYAELSARRAGNSDRAIRAALAIRAGASFSDALWQRFDRERVKEQMRDAVRTPQFCVVILTLLFLLVAFASGGLARTRRILAGAQFGHGDRVVTICIQELLVGRRQGVAPAAIRKWRAEAKSLEQLAAYAFSQPWYQNGFLLHRGPAPASLAHAQVTPEFFRVLGVQPARGRVFDTGDSGACADCLVVTQRLRRQLLGTNAPVVGQTIDYDGRRWRIIGELPEDFWFVTEKLGGVSLMDPATAQGRLVALGLLRPNVTVDAAETELRNIARLSTIEAASLSDRLRGPLRTFGFGSLILLAAAAAVTIGGVLRRKSHWRFWAFFFAKTGSAIAVVLLVAIDYGGAGQLSITGGNQPSEPVAFWLWVVGSVLCIWWAIADQKMRCRVCLRRFVMPVRIGSPDRVLFEHESTEMVCPGGHGTLYVEGMTETFRQEGRWTKLDESWHDLFAGKP
jgi:hypothetical protein